MITQAELKEYLDYNPDTGVFLWLKKPNRLASTPIVGAVAGTKNKFYLAIGIRGKRYQAHRLAWMYIHGFWPLEAIDHINRNGHDNKIANLRYCSNSQNSCNRGTPSNNKSGYKGVVFKNHIKKWQSYIKYRGEQFFCGSFSSAEDAAHAYDKMAMKIHGKFAQLNFPERHKSCG